MFRNRFWVSLLLSIPVLLYSTMIQHWLGFTMPAFPGSAYIEATFSVIIFLYGGIPFLEMAVPEIKTRQPGMMTLICDYGGVYLQPLCLSHWFGDGLLLGDGHPN
jgi:Cu2+-exporting ATPase